MLESDPPLASSSTLADDLALDWLFRFLDGGAFRCAAPRVGLARLFSSACNSAANFASSSIAPVLIFFLGGSSAETSASAGASSSWSTLSGALDGAGVSPGEDGAALVSAWNLSNLAMIRSLTTSCQAPRDGSISPGCTGSKARRHAHLLRAQVMLNGRFQALSDPLLRDGV